MVEIDTMMRCGTIRLSNGTWCVQRATSSLFYTSFGPKTFSMFTLFSINEAAEVLATGLSNGT